MPLNFQGHILFKAIVYFMILKPFTLSVLGEEDKSLTKPIKLKGVWLSVGVFHFFKRILQITLMR